MNREQHLQKTFPLEDGTTYIQSLDRSFTCEYSGLPSLESYTKDSPTEGAGAGGEVEKGNFIDSSPNSLESNPPVKLRESASVDSSADFMYNWIREKSGK